MWINDILVLAVNVKEYQIRKKMYSYLKDNFYDPEIH